MAWLQVMDKNKSDTTRSGIVLLKWCSFLSDYMFRPFLIRPSSGRKFFVEETVHYI